MSKLLDMERVGAGSASKLKDAGIDTVEKLLAKGAKPKDREDLANATGISGKLILEWVNLADLMRIKGVGEELSDLLEEAGVGSVRKLATSNAVNLTARLVEINDKKLVVRQLPGVATVSEWIEQAQSLPLIVETGDAVDSHYTLGQRLLELWEADGALGLFAQGPDSPELARNLRREGERVSG